MTSLSFRMSIGYSKAIFLKQNRKSKFPYSCLKLVSVLYRNTGLVFSFIYFGLGATHSVAQGLLPLNVQETMQYWESDPSFQRTQICSSLLCYFSGPRYTGYNLKLDWALDFHLMHCALPPHQIIATGIEQYNNIIHLLYYLQNPINYLKSNYLTVIELNF